METHPSSPRPSRPVQTPWNVDPKTQGKQSTSWDSPPSTQSTDNHQDRAEGSMSSRLNRQQPIMIQNFELLKPSQLKFKRKSLSTANLYLSQASMHRQGTAPADFQTPDVEMNNRPIHNQNHTHNQPSSENTNRKATDSFPNKIVHSKFPQHNVRGPNSPSKQKRVTFSANNTLHRYEPKPEEHYAWNCPKHEHHNSNNNYAWFRQRDFIYPESYNSSTLPRKDSKGSNSSGYGSTSVFNNKNNENNNSVNIPIRMLLDHYNFGKTRYGRNTIKEDSDNVFEDNSYDWTTEGAVHPDRALAESHTTANNAVTPIHSPDVDDHSSTTTSQWVNNGHAIHEVWSSDRVQLDSNSTNRSRAVPDLGQMHSHILDNEGGIVPETTNNLPRDVDPDTTQQIYEYNFEMNGVVERHGDVMQNRSRGTDGNAGQLQEESLGQSDNKSGSGKQYLNNDVIPPNITPTPKQRTSNSTTTGNVDNRFDNAVINAANTNNSYNDINRNDDDFHDEDDKSSIIANPDDDYNDNNVDNENKTANHGNGVVKTDEVVDKKTTNPNETNRHHQIPVTTFYDAFQEYETIDNVSSKKQTHSYSNPTGPTQHTPNTFRRKPSPSGNLLSQKNNSQSGEKNNNNANVVGQKIIRLNFLKDVDPKSYYSRNNSDANSINGGNKQNTAEIDGSMVVHGLQLRSSVSNTTGNKENDVSSSVRLSKPLKPNLTTNGRPPSQGDINAQFLMNFYSSSGERKSYIDVPFDQLSNTSSSRTLTPRDLGKRRVSFQSGVEAETCSDFDPVARSFRGREMERRLFSSMSARSRAREQQMGSRSRSTSSSAAHLSVSGNGLLHKGVKDPKMSGKGSRLHSAERFLLKTGDSRLAGRTALNLRLEELVVSRSLSSRVKLTMERAKSNIT